MYPPPNKNFFPLRLNRVIYLSFYTTVRAVLEVCLHLPPIISKNNSNVSFNSHFGVMND